MDFGYIYCVAELWRLETTIIIIIIIYYYIPIPTYLILGYYARGVVQCMTCAEQFTLLLNIFY